MNAKEGDYVDHKDHNTLNNRKNNLNCTTQSINMMNRKGANKNNKAGERNVTLVKKNGKPHWLVQFWINEKSVIFEKYPFEEKDRAIKLAKKLRKYIFDDILTDGFTELK
jgi:hypothetical protein